MQGVAVQVEIVSAELAPDGGPAPDVRCTLVQRDLEGVSINSDVRSSVCKHSWNPVWKETLTLLLERRENTQVACTLWDESVKGSEPACLGESAFQLGEFVFFGQGAAVVRGFALHQGREGDKRVVGTVFLRMRHIATSGSLDSPTGGQRSHDARSRKPIESPQTLAMEKGERGLGASYILPDSFNRGSRRDDARSLSPKPSNLDSTPNARSGERNYIPEYSLDGAANTGRQSDQVAPRVSYSDERYDFQRAARQREHAASEKLTTTLLLVRSNPSGYDSQMDSDQVGVGLGLQRAEDGHFFVSSVVSDTPAAHAAEAGMIAIGDVVESVDGQEVRYRSIDEVVRAMKGPMNTHVTLEVRKTGSKRSLETGKSFVDTPAATVSASSRSPIEPLAELGFQNINASLPPMPNHTTAGLRGDDPLQPKLYSNLGPPGPKRGPFSSVTPIDMHKFSATTPGHWPDQTYPSVALEPHDQALQNRTINPVAPNDVSHDPAQPQRWHSLSPYAHPVASNTMVLDRPPVPLGKYGGPGPLPPYSEADPVYFNAYGTPHERRNSRDRTGVLGGVGPLGGPLALMPPPSGQLEKYDNSRTPRGEEAKLMVNVLVFTIDEDFGAASERQEDFWAVLSQDIAGSVSAPMWRFRPLGMQEGSIIAAVEVLDDVTGQDPRPSSVLASSILSQSNQPSSPLRQAPSMQYCRSVILLPYRPAWAWVPPEGEPSPPSHRTALQEAMIAHSKASRSSLDLPPASPKGLPPGGDGKGDHTADAEVSLQAGTAAAGMRVKTDAGVQSLQHEGDGKEEKGEKGSDSKNEGEKATPPEAGADATRDIDIDGGDGGDDGMEGGKEGAPMKDSKPELLDLRQLYFRLAALLMGTVAMGLILASKPTSLPWHWLAWISILLLGMAPSATSPIQFFLGGGSGVVGWIKAFRFWEVPMWQDGVSVWWLAVSTFVAAQEGASGYLAVEHGQRYGSLGAFGFAMWYLGVAIAGIVIFLIRLRHPHAAGLVGLINACYGHEAAGLYALLVLYKLLCLVWAGALSAGRLFVDTDTVTGVFWGGLLCGIAPIIYCSMGGLRALATTHVALAITTAIGMLIGVVSIPPKPCWICGTSSVWVVDKGGDLILVRLFHGAFSLPWVTATLTDRMFLSDPRTSLVGFSLGLFAAWIYTFSSAFIGIYARFINIGEGVPEAYQSLGGEYYHLVLVITLASAMGGIDSAFVAASKLGGLEMYGLLLHREGVTTAQPMRATSQAVGRNNVLAGRITILALATVGLCALAREVSRPGSLAAASLTGTMTMGLFPPAALLTVWRRDWIRSPTGFLLPVGVSLIVGIIQAAGTSCERLLDGACAEWKQDFASNWEMGDGPYALDLGLSVFTLLLSTLSCIVGFAIDQQFRLPDETIGEVNQVYSDSEKSAEGDVEPQSESAQRQTLESESATAEARRVSLPNVVVSGTA